MKTLMVRKQSEKGSFFLPTNQEKQKEPKREKERRNEKERMKGNGHEMQVNTVGWNLVVEWKRETNDSNSNSSTFELLIVVS